MKRERWRQMFEFQSESACQITGYGVVGIDLSLRDRGELAPNISVKLHSDVCPPRVLGPFGGGKTIEICRNLLVFRTFNGEWEYF